MSRPSIDEYYLSLLPLIASRATCPRRQVAAILVDKGGKLVATGYNGVPSGLPHCIDTPCAGAADQSGDTTRCIAIHAEVNACSQARASRRLPYTLYCSTTPCFDCAKVLITEGVKRVVAASTYTDERGLELLAQAGVSYELIKTKPRPRVVCLCGSTRFKNEFIQTYANETDRGYIVLSVGRFVPQAEQALGVKKKQQLDELHKRKIDLSDEVLVINVGGYIGDSTRSEINYALAHNKLVRYLENV